MWLFFHYSESCDVGRDCGLKNSSYSLVSGSRKEKFLLPSLKLMVSGFGGGSYYEAFGWATVTDDIVLPCLCIGFLTTRITILRRCSKVIVYVGPLLVTILFV